MPQISVFKAVCVVAATLCAAFFVHEYPDPEWVDEVLAGGVVGFGLLTFVVP